MAIATPFSLIRNRWRWVWLGLLALGGCAGSPQTLHYLSFQNYVAQQPNARLVTYGTAPLMAPHLLKPIPTGYIIRRRGYALLLDVTPVAEPPVVTVTVRPASRWRIGFATHGEMDRAATRCTHWRQAPDKPDTLRFSWTCGGRSRGSERVMRFTVFDRDGAAVAREAIPFDLLRQGVVLR